MLRFFRKYQKIFFIIITFIIIFSFVFFGTVQTFLPNAGHIQESVLFKTPDGKEVKSLFFQGMCRFLAEENVNYLNDGVISKDFLETNMATLLLKNYRSEFEQDWQARFEKEKNFVAYTHPEIPTLSAENVWSVFAPALKENLKHYREIQEPLSEEAFSIKVALYLQERAFPSSFLAYILRQKEQESGGELRDPRLRGSLPLFGYHNLNDWFGPHFIERITKLILSGASLARQRGYHVSHDEVVADLKFKSEQAFIALKERIHPSISSAGALYACMLREIGMDNSLMENIWQEVMLFRRLFQDVGSAAWVDLTALKDFYSYAQQEAIIDLYELPKELQFKNYEDLKLFEAYLCQVSSHRDSILDLPKSFDAVEEIEKRAPELLKQEVLLEIKSISKKELQMHVSLKEAWEWQEKNQELIASKFPSQEKTEIDQFAFANIVEEHPEWIDEALEAACAKEQKIVFPHPAKSGPILPGIKNAANFKNLLDQESEIVRYSQDQQIYYSLHVKERYPLEVVSFAEAKKNQLLEKYVKLSNMEEHMQKVLAAVYVEAKKMGVTEENNKDLVAPYRFACFLKEYPVAENGLWKLEKQQKAIARGSPFFLSFEEVLQQKPETFSPVCFSPGHGLYFYSCHERKESSEVPAEKVERMQEMVAREAKCHLLQQLLQLP